jgi:transposase
MSQRRHTPLADVPLILAFVNRLRLGELLDEHFPTHGNRKGLSLGTAVAGWLTHIISEGDHCLVHVRNWAEIYLSLLRTSLHPEARAVDWSDDSLARTLNYLADEEKFARFEAALFEQIILVHPLPAERVRVDATMAPSYREVSQDGLFRRSGEPKANGRLPQMKLSVAVLDQSGLPITSIIYPGNQADCGTYLPTIEGVRNVVGDRRLLYIGDSKMCATQVRAALQQAGDGYLCPYAPPQLTPNDAARAWRDAWQSNRELIGIFRKKGESPWHPPLLLCKAVPQEWLFDAIQREPAQDEDEPIALGYEFTVQMVAKAGEEEVRWQERRLVVASLGQARAAYRTLVRRRATALQELERLNRGVKGRPRPQTRSKAEEAVEKILKSRSMEGIIECSLEEEPYNGRPYSDTPRSRWHVRVQVDEEAWRRAICALGWRIYATNVPVTRLTFTEAVLTYRGQYQIEGLFDRLKNRPLSLTPIYLHDERRIRGLTNLLLLALRLHSLIEHQVRENLATQERTIRDVYPGQPGRQTARPTTELLLRRFRHIAAVYDHRVNAWCLEGWHPVITDILQLLGMSDEVYRSVVRLLEPPRLE